jgi:hypothetical protein
MNGLSVSALIDKQSSTEKLIGTPKSHSIAYRNQTFFSIQLESFMEVA